MVQHLRIAFHAPLSAVVLTLMFIAFGAASAQQLTTVQRGSSPIEAIDGSISGAVFIDANASAELDLGEIGLGSVLVRCDAIDANGRARFTRTISTNENGFYTFTSLEAGRYRLTVDQDADAASVSGSREIVVEITGESQNVIGSMPRYQNGPTSSQPRISASMRFD